MFRGVDVRTLGSGNLGATNVFRSLGRGLGIATLLLDIAKGAVPVWILPRLAVGQAFPGGAEACALAVGLAAVAGHVWTCFAGFKGGKGVATTVGVLLAVAPRAFVVFIVVFGLVVAITRYISLGSVLGAIAFAIALALPGSSVLVRAFGIAIALLVIVRHRDNIVRLLRGTERRFEWSRSADS
jgi:glycerol-3-phosphate acyltransferase PlsY